MSNVAFTSKLAFTSIKCKLGTKQEIVHNAISTLGKASNEMLADYLGWPINSITGRVTELKKYGLIDVEGITVNKSGHSAKLWSIRDANDNKFENFTLDCE